MQEELAEKTSKPAAVELEENLSDLVTPEVFARYLGVTKTTVRGMMERRRLPVIRVKNPEKPEGQGDRWIHKGAWDQFCTDMLAAMPQEWWSWQDCYFVDSTPILALSAQQQKRDTSRGRAPRYKRTY